MEGYYGQKTFEFQKNMALVLGGRLYGVWSEYGKRPEEHADAPKGLQN